MRRFGYLTLVAILVLQMTITLAFGQSATGPQKEVMTNASVIELVKLGLGEAVIIQKIRQSERKFDTTNAGLAQLKAARVSDNIIMEMMNPGGPTNNYPTIPDLSQYYGIRQPNSSYLKEGKKQYLQPNSVALSPVKESKAVESVEGDATSAANEAFWKSAEVMEVGATFGSEGMTMAGAQSVLTIYDAMSKYSIIKRYLPSTERSTYLILAANRRASVALETTSPQLHLLYEDVAGVNPDDFEPVLVKFVTTKDNYRVAGVLRLVHKKGVMSLKPKLTCSFVEQRIPIKIKSVGRGEAEIEPETPLDKGEYAVVLRPHWKSKEVNEKDVKEIQVAQALMNVMWDFSIPAAYQNRTTSLAGPSTQQVPQATERPSTVVGQSAARLEQSKDNDSSGAQELPTYGKIEDIKDFHKVYVHADSEQSRQRILKALKDDKDLEVVNDPAQAQIVLEYKVLSHDSSIEKGTRNINEKSQLQGLYVKDGKRIVAWSDTSEFAQSSEVIGFRTQYSEIKLTERFIKVLKKANKP